MGIQERKERERQRRRQEILVAAKRVFSEKGFNKATMEDIAKEAELSQGTLYLYFKNKDELYASLPIRILKYLGVKMNRINEQRDLTPPERLDALKRGLYDVYEFDPLILIDMFHLESSETLKNLSPEFLTEINKLSGSALNAMARIFQECIDEGYIINKHPVALSGILWALFSGIILWEESKKMIDSEKDFLEKTFDTAFEIFSRGIQKEATFYNE